MLHWYCQFHYINMSLKGITRILSAHMPHECNTMYTWKLILKLLFRLYIVKKHTNYYYRSLKLYDTRAELNFPFLSSDFDFPSLWCVVWTAYTEALVSGKLNPYFPEDVAVILGSSWSCLVRQLIRQMLQPCLYVI